MWPTVKKLLGEEWTAYGHRPFCPCDSCWTEKRFEGWRQRLANREWPVEIYRSWWERPLFVIVVVACAMLVWRMIK